MNGQVLQETKLNIVLLGSQIATGGAQRMLLGQARWFHAHGHKVCVVFIYDREELLDKWQDEAPFPIINLNANQRGASFFVRAASIVRGMWKLWGLLGREKFDAIETFTYDSNIFAIPLAWLAGIPIRIATHHGMVENLPLWRRMAHTILINFGIADILVAVSVRTKKQAISEGVSSRRVVVIQNGIESVDLSGINASEARNEMGLADDRLFLVSVGRLAYQKGHDILLLSMPAILKEYPNVVLGIVGNGLIREQLESQIVALNLKDSVKLFGNRGDVIRFLAIADIFILPSRWEGLPIALLEAMSAGLPVVATSVEGVEEVVNPGEHGWLVPVEDSCAIAEAIIDLLRHPEKRRVMGLSSRRRIERDFSIDRMCNQYLDIMLRLHDQYV